MKDSVNFSTHYRPMTFADVVGQDIPKLVLKKIASAPGISARSIFLKGAYGSGKSTLARIFGRAVNCEQFLKTGEVCNECDACKEALAANSQLYYEFDSSVAGNIDAIRSLQEKLAYTPNGRRVVVFDEIHAASRAAQNAMLKMIEDGIPNTFFVFASTEDILPTLKSRSICLDVTTIPHDLIKERLKFVAADRNISVSDVDLDSIAIKSGGHMRNAMSILQLYSLAGAEALESSYTKVVKFFKAACGKKKDIAEQLLQEILKFNVVDVRNSINLFIRNAFIADANSDLYIFVSSGLISKIYSYTFSQVSQLALKDEMGVELYFRSFLEKVCK